jgi:RNA polymerase sigma-70 factor (ECF subfamily)
MEQPRLQYDQAFLLSGLTQGDPVVFRLIYKLYWRKLYNIAYYYIHSEQDAEDIVQDVFISLWSRREKIELRGALENYLVRCVKYTAFFYLKIKDKKSAAFARLSASPATDGPEEYIRYKDLQGYLVALMESVSQKTRDIFYLSRFDGLSYAEIAQRLQVSVKTVEYHISLALKKLAGGDF